MGFIKGFIMSLGMFSVFPVPKSCWNDRYMPAVIPGLPLAGVLIGLIWYGLAYLLLWLPAPMLQSAIILFIPFFLSGFIHTDGFMDTADAVFSRRSFEEKKKILKDPLSGAFAVIAVVSLLILQFSAVYTIVISQKSLLAFAFIPIVSRGVAGIALLNLKPVFETGYGAMFSEGARPRHTVFICALLLLCFLAAWLKLGLSASPVLVGTLAGLLAVLYLYRQFRGMSGDLCGCVITVSEFTALICMAL